MSSMSNLRRKQTNYGLHQNQIKKDYLQRAGIINFLRRIKKRSRANDDYCSVEILEYLLYCCYQDITPTKDEIKIIVRDN